MLARTVALLAVLALGSDPRPRPPDSPPPGLEKRSPRPPKLAPPRGEEQKEEEEDSRRGARKLYYDGDLFCNGVPYTELRPWETDDEMRTDDIHTALNYTAAGMCGNCSDGIQNFGEPDVDCGLAVNMTYTHPAAHQKHNTFELIISDDEKQEVLCAPNHDPSTPCTGFKTTIRKVFCPQKCAVGKKCNMPNDANNTLDYPIRLNAFNGKRNSAKDIGYKGFDCETGFCEDSYNTGQARCVTAYRKVPKMYPYGGKFVHPIKVRLTSFRNHKGDRVHYTKVVKLGAEDRDPQRDGDVSVSPSTNEPSVPSGGWVLIDEDTILLAASYDEDGQLLSSTVTVGNFEIARGRYGYGYFVPYYNSAIGFSGMLTRLDLQSPGTVPDFANFQTSVGLGAYDGQLRVLDLTQIDPELKGFQGGFQALGTTINSSVTNYAFLVPFFNGRFHGLLTRVNLDYFSLCAVEPREDVSKTKLQFFDPSDGTWAEFTHPRAKSTTTVPNLYPERWADVGTMEYGNHTPEHDPGPNKITNGKGHIELYRTLNEEVKTKRLYGGSQAKGWKNNFCGVEVIDLEHEVDAGLTGFKDGFAFRHWGYLVPYTNGRKFTSTVVRFSVTNFDADHVETLDVSKALEAKCGGVNYPHDAVHGTSTTVDPILCSKQLAGFGGGLAYDGHGYLLPYKHAESIIQGQHTTHGVNSELPVDKGQFETRAHGLLVRFDLVSFDDASVEFLDLTQRDDDLRGYSGGFMHDHWLYLVPYISRYQGLESGTPSRRNSFHGKLTRVNLDSFNLRGIEWLTLTDLDPDLRGFSAGFSWSNFGYLVPFTNDEKNFRQKTSFGKVVKIDLSQFASLAREDLHVYRNESVLKVLNLPTIPRVQIPNMPDHNLRGFSGAFAAGDYAYFVPNFNGDFFGKVPRLNLLTDQIQVLDMQQDGEFLSGYSTGFTHTSRRICCDPQMGHRPTVCRPLDFDMNGDVERHGELPWRNYCGSLDTVSSHYHPFKTHADPLLQNVVKELRQEPWEPQQYDAPQYVRAVAATGWTTVGEYEGSPLGFNLIRQDYPNEADTAEDLPNKKLYEVIKRRVFNHAGGAPHIGAPAVFEPPAGFATQNLDHYITYYMYRGINTRISTLAPANSGAEFTQLGSRCCNFLDQHEIEYVLWDRRAYTRDWMIPVTSDRVLPKRCLFKQCELDSSIVPALPPSAESYPQIVAHLQIYGERTNEATLEQVLNAGS